MGNIPPETQRQIAAHISKQEDLVRNLESVIQQQGAALTDLVGDDDDFGGDEADADSDASGCEEFDLLTKMAQKAETRAEPEPPVDDDEKKAPDVEYKEPTEDEERNFAATKPWLGAMAPPSGYKKNSAWDEKPSIALELEYVHGYRARMCRNNAFWVDHARICYFAAGVGIVQDVNTDAQTFFQGHTDDILSMDYHSGSRLVVTGEQGRTPKICVWNVDTCELVCEYKGYHKRAIVSVAFSKNGQLIASVGCDDNHSVAVYQVGGGLIAESKGDSSKILQCRWNTTAGSDANSEFATVGKKHIKFWRLAGSSLEAQKGLLGRKGKRQTFICLDFTENQMIVSCAGGELYFFTKNKLSKVHQAHSGACYSLAIDKRGGRILTGGKDNTLRVWQGGSMNKVAQFSMERYESPTGTAATKNYVRSISVFGDEVLVGTIASSLFTLNLATKAVHPLVKGHYGDLLDKEAYGELWGLAVHPKQNVYATCAEDQTLRVWTMQDHKQSVRKDLGGNALCCAYSPDGGSIAVGFKTGHFCVIDTSNMSEELRKRNSRRRIVSAKYSPDGNYLALGSADNKVLIYDVQRDYKLCGKGTGASSVILHVDWSDDSKWLQTMSQAYELLFFEGATGKYNPRSRDLKDVHWATQECTLGWNVQGIWPKYSDGSDVNIVNRSVSEKYLATAEDSGLVKVFHYPCIGSGLDRRGSLARRPESICGRGHSSHVTNVNWSNDDSYVLTTGGGDLTVMQWRVKS